MNSMERVLEYIVSAPLEKAAGLAPPVDWPSHGAVEFRGYETGYGEGLPSVLKGLTMRFEAGQRVGVVGRTGSGKSTLTLALFRFLEAREGSILIDGVDISRLAIRDLRRNLAIIPQDPVLFSGTIRSNLDPFERYSNRELRDEMAKLRLGNGKEGSSEMRVRVGEERASKFDPAESPLDIFSDLNFKISRGGLNLSSGQRQLVCLGKSSSC